MDLVYNEKLAKNKTGVNFLLLHQDLLGRTVYAKMKKTKFSEETVWAFSEKNPLTKV